MDYCENNKNFVASGTCWISSVMYFVLGCLFALGLFMLYRHFYCEEDDNGYVDDVQGNRAENRYAIYLDEDELKQPQVEEKTNILDLPPIFTDKKTITHNESNKYIAATDSFYIKVRSNPPNTVIDVMYNYESSSPKISLMTLPNTSDILITVKGSNFAYAGNIDGEYRAFMHVVNEDKANLMQSVILSQEPKDISITSEYMVIVFANTVVLYKNGVIDYDFHSQILPLKAKVNTKYVSISTTGGVYVMKRLQVGYYDIESTIMYNDPSFGKLIDMNDEYLSIQSDSRIFVYSLKNLSNPEFELGLDFLQTSDISHYIGDKMLAVYDSMNVYTYWVTSKKKWILGRIWSAAVISPFLNVYLDKDVLSLSRMIGSTVSENNTEIYKKTNQTR